MTVPEAGGQLGLDANGEPGSGAVSGDGDPILKRIQGVAGLCGILAAVAYGLLRGPLGAGVLTLTAAASIVNFRGLEAFVRLLEPRRQGTLGTRNTLLIALRLVFLAGVVVAVLVLGSRHLLALILGLSVIPAALMLEALRAALGLVRRSR